MPVKWSDHTGGFQARQDRVARFPRDGESFAHRSSRCAIGKPKEGHEEEPEEDVDAIMVRLRKQFAHREKHQFLAADTKEKLRYFVLRGVIDVGVKSLRPEKLAADSNVTVRCVQDHGGLGAILNTACNRHFDEVQRLWDDFMLPGVKEPPSVSALGHLLCGHMLAFSSTSMMEVHLAAIQIGMHSCQPRVEAWRRGFYEELPSILERSGVPAIDSVFASDRFIDYATGRVISVAMRHPLLHPLEIKSDLLDQWSLCMRRWSRG